MRTNKQLKEIRKSLDSIKVMYADLGNDSLDANAVIMKLSQIKHALREIVHRFDSVDKVWAKEKLVNTVHRELNQSIDRYNDVRSKVSDRFAKAGVDREIRDVETAFNATDIPYRDAEASSYSLRSYINNSNNGRAGAIAVRVASKAGALLGIAGLGGAVFVLANQNAKLNDNYANLQSSYAIIESESEEAKRERDEWESKYYYAVENGGSGVSQGDYDKVVSENTSLKAENAELKAEYDALKNEYNTVKEAYDSVVAEYNAIMAVIPEGSDAVEYITGLKTQVDTLGAKVTELEGTIDGLETAMSALNSKVKDLEGQLEAALADGTNQALIKTLREQLAESQANYTTLENQYKTAIAEHAKTVKEYETQVTTLTSALDAEKAKNKELTDKNTALESENSEINDAYDALIDEIGSTYSNVISGGEEKDPIKQFNAVIEYYCAQAGDSNEVTEFLIKFVAEIKGVSYEEVAKLSPAELVYAAEQLVGLPSAPSETPNENVHENENSSATDSSDSTDTSKEEKEEQENEDGTGNISPDLPPVRE